MLLLRPNTKQQSKRRNSCTNVELVQPTIDKTTTTTDNRKMMMLRSCSSSRINANSTKLLSPTTTKKTNGTFWNRFASKKRRNRNNTSPSKPPMMTVRKVSKNSTNKDVVETPNEDNNDNEMMVIDFSNSIADDDDDDNSSYDGDQRLFSSPVAWKAATPLPIQPITIQSKNNNNSESNNKVVYTMTIDNPFVADTTTTKPTTKTNKEITTAALPKRRYVHDDADESDAESSSSSSSSSASSSLSGSSESGSSYSRNSRSQSSRRSIDRHDIAAKYARQLRKIRKDEDEGYSGTSTYYVRDKDDGVSSVSFDSLRRHNPYWTPEHQYYASSPPLIISFTTKHQPTTDTHQTKEDSILPDWQSTWLRQSQSMESQQQHQRYEQPNDENKDKEQETTKQQAQQEQQQRTQWPFLSNPLQASKRSSSPESSPAPSPSSPRNKILQLKPVRLQFNLSEPSNRDAQAITTQRNEETKPHRTNRRSISSPASVDPFGAIVVINEPHHREQHHVRNENSWFPLSNFGKISPKSLNRKPTVVSPQHRMTTTGAVVMPDGFAVEATLITTQPKSPLPNVGERRRWNFVTPRSHQQQQQDVVAFPIPPPPIVPNEGDFISHGPQIVSPLERRKNRAVFGTNNNVRPKEGTKPLFFSAGTQRRRLIIQRSKSDKVLNGTPPMCDTAAALSSENEILSMSDRSLIIDYPGSTSPSKNRLSLFNNNRKNQHHHKTTKKNLTADCCYESPIPLTPNTSHTSTTRNSNKDDPSSSVQSLSDMEVQEEIQYDPNASNSRLFWNSTTTITSTSRTPARRTIPIQLVSPRRLYKMNHITQKKLDPESLPISCLI